MWFSLRKVHCCTGWRRVILIDKNRMKRNYTEVEVAVTDYRGLKPPDFILSRENGGGGHAQFRKTLISSHFCTLLLFVWYGLSQTGNMVTLLLSRENGGKSHAQFCKTLISSHFCTFLLFVWKCLSFLYYLVGQIVSLKIIS